MACSSGMPTTKARARSKTNSPASGFIKDWMNMSKQITLMAWAAVRFDPPPSLWTLRRMAREGRIEPAPVKVGKSYFVPEDALPVDPNRKPSLLARIKKGH